MSTDDIHNPTDPEVVTIVRNNEIENVELSEEIKRPGPKALSNPFSTGGGGPSFENKVQTVFVIMMLAGSHAPCLPPWPIVKIHLQGRHAGYNTDDFIVVAEEPGGARAAKLLAQIKRSVAITENDSTFGEVIAAAWADFNDSGIFDSEVDQIALISGPLSATDCEDARTILEWARTSPTSKEFFEKVNLTNFSSTAKRAKLSGFRTQLMKANGGKDIGDDVLFKFLKRFHLLGFDLDGGSSTSFSLVTSILSIFGADKIHELFGSISIEVARFNQSAGTITIKEFPDFITELFIVEKRVTIPEGLNHISSDVPKGDTGDAILFASLIGGWNDDFDGDNEVLKKLLNEK